MIRRFIKFIYPVLTNKYLLSISFFLVWIIIFDRNNIIDRYRMVREVDHLQKDRKYYSDRIIEDSTRLSELRSDDENLEKFAREQYLMKRENEVVFVIED